MIQAQLPKPIETKSSGKSEDVSNLKTAQNNESGESVEGSEFANALKATVETGDKVAPIEISQNQVLELSPQYINQENLQTGLIDTTAPQAFDPEVTKDVQKLIAPKINESKLKEILPDLVIDEAIVPNEKSELSQVILKTPQVVDLKSSRSPAVELATSEVDPQLLNNEDFMLQKNLVSKKAAQNAYGMNLSPAQQKVMLENGLENTQVIKDPSIIDNSSSKSQEFILNLVQESKPVQVNDNQPMSIQKIFDMNQVKSSNSEQIISQITDYVVQAKASKEPNINLRMNHDQLGLIDINVAKSGASNEVIAINIGTHTTDGKNFFQSNSKDLMTHLSSAGFTVSEMKVEVPSQAAKNDFNFSQHNKNDHGAQKQFGSEQNQRRHEQERRQDLWKLLNKEAA